MSEPERESKGSKDLPAILVLTAMIVAMAVAYAIHFGYGHSVKTAGLWAGSLVLLVVVVIAVVGATSASWTAGRRVGRVSTVPSAAAPSRSDAPNVVSGPLADDAVGALTQLARLHATGALTDAEFAAAKERVLDRSPRP
jgi:hypothetical protein